MISKETSVEIKTALGEEGKEGIMALVKLKMIVSFALLSEQFCWGLCETRNMYHADKSRSDKEY